MNFLVPPELAAVVVFILAVSLFVILVHEFPDKFMGSMLVLLGVFVLVCVVQVAWTTWHFGTPLPTAEQLLLKPQAVLEK